VTDDGARRTGREEREKNLLVYLLSLFQRDRPQVDGLDVLLNAVVKQNHVGTWEHQTTWHYNVIKEY